MTSAADRALALLTPLIGQESAAGEWVKITQDQIDAFARVTRDDQFIHTDPVRAAKESPFGTTIAHGFFTLSLVSFLVKSVPRPQPDPLQGRAIGINYGMEKVRFPAPVRVNSRLRARQCLLSVEKKDDHTMQMTHRTTIEIEGESKPACVADWVTRAIYA
jgi:acyl dehydratase